MKQLPVNSLHIYDVTLVSSYLIGLGSVMADGRKLEEYQELVS